MYPSTSPTGDDILSSLQLSCSTGFCNYFFPPQSIDRDLYCPFLCQIFKMPSRWVQLRYPPLRQRPLPLIWSYEEVKLGDEGKQPLKGHSLLHLTMLPICLMIQSYPDLPCPWFTVSLELLRFFPYPFIKLNEEINVNYIPIYRPPWNTV